MQDLFQAHIPLQAGCPTHKGYRFFVDSLVTMKSPNKSELDVLQNSLNTSNTNELINITADTLSSLTNFAGVVMLPKAKKISFKHIEFFKLIKNKNSRDYCYK